MSSEGERYPVEPNVAALVFAFYCLRLCPPYWSCEGHLSPDGSIRRLPQVWFYSRSLVYPRLIADRVAQLYFEKQLANPWHVCVCYSESGLDTGFSLEPDVKMIDKPDLFTLQRDVAVMAERLPQDLLELAREYRSRYGRAA